jgi:hypothetical protein
LRVPFPSQFLQGFFFSSLLLGTIPSRSIMALFSGRQNRDKTRSQYNQMFNLLVAEDRYRRSAHTISSLDLWNPGFRLTATGSAAAPSVPCIRTASSIMVSIDSTK